ncbi:SLC13 family permease [Xylella fastidiosa subsp. morus]|uniref:SLC13 family permease n=1 Tax=Xylella fastidiosa subsp. multiplex TaxID=644357 RepID=A0A9Q4QS62_XYLFS|nr:SLC13 family permease [Xylella fastidiosa]ERI60091.1 sulfur deprivation response regulator [Xylella fastidiosa subsp. multiplex Griffin-1]ACA12925.1 sulfur deprivation response regulator [Xylella fastidiosa M12]AIC11814.1 sulfur deprivation response regulator [Xylella fastidiosa MUL0034]EWG14841.1 sulfur deprivation response regulator [Xylella fastidiosa Mul-MD]KAJ4853631.1 SLC13 family permease [Xylella fastidiosa subsp. multiplex]
MDTALTLTNDMKLVLGLVGFTMAMFVWERIRADVVALIVLVVLGTTGLIPPEELFGGFSGNAVMSIIATAILGAGLERTGALNRLAAWLLRRSHGSERRLLLITLGVAGLNSPFMQNTSVMALYMPVAARLAARTGLTLQRLLLPIAAMIVMGGALTMVGNSPLILLNDLLQSANNNLPSGIATIEPLRMFAPLPIGVALLIAALLYFFFYGDRKLIQEEQLANEEVTAARHESYFARTYGIDADVFELVVNAESPLVGMTVGEAETIQGAPLLLALKTGNDTRLSPPVDMRIWVGSVLGAMGPRQQVADFAKNQLLNVSSRLRHLGDLFNPACAGICEVVIPPNSRFIDKTSTELRLRKQMGISLLAINRDKHVIREDVRNVPLRAGDMLVLHSLWQDLAQAAESRDFVPVTDYPKGEQRPHKFKIAMAIFAFTILIALTAKLPVALTLLTGVACMLVTGVIRMDEAYTAISWKTIFMMAGLIPLGWAMDSSGTAAWVAGHTIDRLPHGMPIWAIELAMALLTTAFSLVISHVGATIVMVPIAVNVALAANGNPTAFGLIVALAASNNLMTVSNPVISMVTGPANYQPRELWKVGGPLSLIYIVVMVVMINLMSQWGVL